MMLIKRSLKILPLHMLVCGLLATQACPVKALDDSIEGAREVMVHLARLSEKRALQTEAARRLMTGEMLGLKIETFGRLTSAPDKVVLLDKTSAVGRFQLTGENNRIVDVYFYLKNEGGWKVSAVRLLALTGIIEQVYAGLKARPNLTYEERDVLENARLTLASDSELKLWFPDNRAALKKLCDLVRAQSGGGGAAPFYVGRDDKKYTEAALLLRKLNLSTASLKANGNVELVIGGMTDNTVGFIYSPLNEPPKISPSLYIWVEEVAPNWYLFRTT